MKTAIHPKEVRMTTIPAIRDISQVIVGSFDLQELLDRVVGTLKELSRSDTCSIWLIDPDGKVRIKAASGYHDRLLAVCPDYLAPLKAGLPDDCSSGKPVPAEYDLGEGLTGQIVRTGQPVRTTGEQPNKEAHPEWAGKYDKFLWPEGANECRSLFGAPLKAQERTIGVLKIENKKDTAGELAIAFTEEDEEVLTILANVIGVAIENQRLAEERSKQTEEAWRLVSARLAHKIGNQNFATRGILGELQNAKLPATTSSLIDRAVQCCDAIGVVVEEAKKFSGPLVLQRSHCLIGQFVTLTVQNQSFPDWHPEYRFHAAGNKDVEINLDRAQLRHALMELLENSQGFKKTGACIEIHTGRADAELLARYGLNGDYAFIDYRDNGPGIPEDKKQSILSRLSRSGRVLGLACPSFAK